MWKSGLMSRCAADMKALLRVCLRSVWKVLRILLMAGMALGPMAPPPPPPPPPRIEARVDATADEEEP